MTAINRIQTVIFNEQVYEEKLKHFFKDILISLLRSFGVGAAVSAGSTAITGGKEEEKILYMLENLEKKNVN